MDQPKRILVVEDDSHIADLICLHLRDEHFDFSAAHTHRTLSVDHLVRLM